MVHNAPWGRKPLLQLHLFHVKDFSALQLHAQQIPHSLHFITWNPTAKFLIDSTAYLGQIEVSDYFLKPSLKGFHSFLCSVFLFFLPPPPFSSLSFCLLGSASVLIRAACFAFPRPPFKPLAGDFLHVSELFSAREHTATHPLLRPNPFPCWRNVFFGLPHVPR